jgi:hypothetical protein
MNTQLLESLAQMRELSDYLARRSREICAENGCAGDDHNCESYAYVRCDGRLLDICASDFFQGCSEPYAAIALPWTGTHEDLAGEILNQCDE